jgi:hypothetical protein
MTWQTTTVDDFDRFLKNSLNQGAETRKQHGGDQTAISATAPDAYTPTDEG